MKPELLPTVPEPIAPDTWLIPSLAADPAGGFLGAHSAVIRGTEPVVLDTSVLFGRDQWLQNAFSVVEPEVHAIRRLMLVLSIPAKSESGSTT